MPYKGHNDRKLPDPIKALPVSTRRQWVAVWNDVYSVCMADDGVQNGCEQAAFAAANAVVKEDVPINVPSPVKANALIGLSEIPETPMSLAKRSKVRTAEKLARSLITGSVGLKTVLKIRDLQNRNRQGCDEFIWLMYGGSEGDVWADSVANRLAAGKVDENKTEVKSMNKTELLAAIDALGMMVAELPDDDEPMDVEGDAAQSSADDPAPNDAEIETAESDVTELAEIDSGAVVSIVEKADEPGELVPLALDVVVIQPGLGNKRDRNYYSAEMLKRDAPEVFDGAKMYETDHREDERSTRTWVSTIKAIDRFTEQGAPIARVIVHDPSFARRVIALEKGGLLHKMECSIVAAGQTVEGTIDGEPCNIVKRITEAHSVDWVTAAGAGGHAVKFTEKADDDEPDVIEEVGSPEKPAALVEQDTPLDEAVAAAIIDESILRQPYKERLKSLQWMSEAALKAAILDELRAYKEATGSGTPFNINKGATGSLVQPRSKSEARRVMREIDKQIFNGGL